MKPASFAAICACAAACSGGEMDAPRTETSADSPAARIEGTPPGGLVEWVSDIRNGIADLPALVERDAEEASKRATDLYANRQEWLERYYGKWGTLTRDTASPLGAAVMEAEARFHELMILLLETPGRAEVERRVGVLDAQLQQVLGEAERIPLPPVPDSTRADALSEPLTRIRSGLDTVVLEAQAGEVSGAKRRALRLYLDVYERIEASYGGPPAPPAFTALVMEGERRFGALYLEEDAGRIVQLARELRSHMDRLSDAAPADLPASAAVVSVPVSGRQEARTAEVIALLAELETARAAYEGGDGAGALARVERAYLDRFEPLEARLPASVARGVESVIHLRLRPRIASGAPQSEVTEAFDAVRAGLLVADEHLDRGASPWFGMVNAFAIIVREGLEAVLLVAAILAYLGATSAERRHRRLVYAGVGGGLAATFGTWLIARTLVPVTGAGRELLEGVTALVAVGVLLYVSHWLFRKAYLHDWKQYLREQVGRAVTTGSSFAMAGLAFAAVYREGFETVLFYQALMFDAGPGAVMAGFVPGVIVIVALGIAILRLGMKLPLRAVFGVTNAVLLYLAFVFLGKGLYNLQEAGAFAARPIAWLPDHEALRQFAGFYPVQQTLVAQAALLLLLTATWLIYRLKFARLATERA